MIKDRGADRFIQSVCLSVAQAELRRERQTVGRSAGRNEDRRGRRTGSGKGRECASVRSANTGERKRERERALSLESARRYMYTSQLASESERTRVGRIRQRNKVGLRKFLYVYIETLPSSLRAAIDRSRTSAASNRLVAKVCQSALRFDAAARKFNVEASQKRSLLYIFWRHADRRSLPNDSIRRYCGVYGALHIILGC